MVYSGKFTFRKTDQKYIKNGSLFSSATLIEQFAQTFQFVILTELLRYALYEDIPVPKEDVPPEKQVPPVPAYERYASISKTTREVRRDRYNAKLEKLVS